MKKDIHPEYHRIKVVMTDGTEFEHLFDLRRRRRHAEARHRSEDASGLDRRQPASDRPRRTAVPLQAEIRRLPQIAAYAAFTWGCLVGLLAECRAQARQLRLERTVGLAPGGSSLVPEHLIEPDHPLLELDALLDQLAQTGRQRAEIARRLIAAGRPAA